MKFLIVENNPVDQELIVQLLQKNFCGSEFVRIIHRQDFDKAIVRCDFDVVIIEYRLDWADGMWIVRALKERMPFIPVIMVTNTRVDEIAVEGVRSGLSDLISKKHLHYLPGSVKESIKKSRQFKTYYETSRIYHSLFEEASDTISLTDIEGNVFEVNKKAEELTGYTKEELIHMNFVQFHPGEEIERVIAAFKEGVRKGAGCINDTLILRKDGRTVPVDITGSVIECDDAKVVQVIIRDITEQKQVKDALRKSEAQYRLLFESNPHPMWVCDQETLAFLAVNDAAVRHYGYTREEFLNMTIKEIRPPKDIPNLLDYLRRERESSVLCFAGVWKHRKKDGTLIDVEITKNHISFNEGKAILVLAHDVTERKQVERRLAVQYAIMRILAESVSLQEGTPKILQAVCECLEWDLGALWTIDNKTNVLRCVEVWHRPSTNVPEFLTLSRQIVFSPGIGLPGRVWSSREPSWIADVVTDTNFPRAPIAAKEGLHGAFCFPILIGKEILGVIEFFSHDIQQPDKDLLDMANAIGCQIGQFIERKQVEESLRHRIEFEKSVASISTRFTRILDFDNAVSLSLADIGRLCNVSRSYLFQFRDNGTIVDNTHEWCNDGVTPEIQNLQNLPSAMFPWWMANLNANNVIHIVDVSKMPPEAAAEKEILEKQGVKSLLGIPVFTEKKLVGFIGFDNVVNTGTWPEEDIDLLHITAEIIGNAIARKQAKEALSHIAYHDSLTNLPNRILFQDRLHIDLIRAKRNERIVAVMILDLDYFKNVNDSLGHHTGDLLLKAVAERLMQCIRASDTIARMSGDEFMVILPDLAHTQDAAIVAQKMLDILSQPFQIEGHKINTTASAGISLYPLDAVDTESLVKQADIAMYNSKKKGKNTYRFYNNGMNTHV